MNTAFFINYPADAIMPPEPYQPDNEEDIYVPEPEPEENEAPIETIDIEAAPITPAPQATEAPTEKPTIAIKSEAETHSLVAAEDPTVNKQQQSYPNALIQTLAIILPILLAALIAVIVMLIVSKKKKKKMMEAQQQAFNQMPENYGPENTYPNQNSDDYNNYDNMG